MKREIAVIARVVGRDSREWWMRGEDRPYILEPVVLPEAHETEQAGDSVSDSKRATAGSKVRKLR